MPPEALAEIAVLAEAYSVPIAPHCTASYLGIAASLHVACATAPRGRANEGKPGTRKLRFGKTQKKGVF